MISHTVDAVVLQLRAFWYLIEVLARENNDVASGYIDIVWDKYSSLYDFDRLFGESVPRFERTAWPIRVTAHHICCSSAFVVTIMKPIYFAMTDKRNRSRTLFHTVPESKIVDTLSNYGILGSMLPTEMGGTLEFSQSDWIAQRRALEMEEI